ncbi:MAG TPA: hypothetical protein VGL94_08730 [Ktedonobacteraceae bacterium]|jgi:hypothetical protein
MSKEYNALTVRLLRNSVIINVLRVGIIETRDRMQLIKSTLIDVFDNMNKVRNIIDVKENYAGALSSWLEESIAAETFKHQALGMIQCQSVQSFDLYIRNMLIKVFNQHHELLEQDKLNKIESDLQFNNTEAFIAWLVDEKLRVLDYQGFESVLNYLHETIGLDLKVDPAECLYVSEMFLARNIILYNNGYVNGNYLEKSNRKDLQLGDLYPLTEEYISEGVQKLLALGQTLDTQFVVQFNLS